MANNMMVASMESMRTTMDSARDNVRDMTRLASSNARVGEEIARGMTRASSSSFTSRTGSAEEREEGRQRR
jgi:hypothetical protein